MRRTLLVIASIIVSVVFMYFVLRDVPLDAVLESAQQANPLWLLISFGMITMTIVTRGIRWRGLLDNRISQRDAFFIMSVTFLLNQLPLRAGEVARSLLATGRGVPLLTAATSIVIERMLDTLLVVLSLLLALSQLSTVPPTVSQSAALFGVLGVIAFAILLVFARYPQLAHRLLNTIFKIIPPLRKLPLESLLDNVLDGLKPLTNPRRFAHAISWTLIAWAFSYGGMLTLLIALNIVDVDMLMTSILGVSLASFSVAIPVSVAAIGPFEAAIAITGEIVGMENIQAVTLGLIVHGVTVLTYVVWGVVGLLAMGVSLGDVLGKAKREDPNT
ncbi:flippase-like domain-containing protein [Phototrophicus methaneseepsis]|uniref:Flippase-like domain-containing protein n=1 Tax=Phototrophicus methaneseepsis TaxID=2710758 RepID=A0A7S8EBG8_9CHLR|nr:lysylphosphatidylglycerol synthase transmembrane domain-containing protein [Phototrophicus methaneseepsis]QPC83920.1 flippase-like domain-containing protein [Phototrophicus methaneseepsis]